MKSRLTQLRVALTAILGVVFVLVGWPALLLAAAHGPLRPYLPAWSGLVATVVDPGGLLLLLVLVGAGAAWLATASALLVELVTQASGIRAPRLGRLFPQAPMARLAGAALLVLPASGLLAPSAAVAAPAGTGFDPGAAAPISVNSEDRDCVPDKPKQHTVQPGESLWSIADEELGRGQRYPELFRASQGIRQPGGRSLTDPDVILPGWRIRIPAAAQDGSDNCGPLPAAGRGPTRPLPELDRAPVADPSPSQGDAGTESPDLAGAAGVGESAGTSGPETATSPSTTPAPVGAAASAAATGAPADLEVSAVRVLELSATSARLSWDATAGASWYWVQVGGQSIRSTTTEVALDGLSPDAQHTVAVRAVAPDGRWGPAADFGFSTPDAPGPGHRRAAASRGTAGRASALALLALRPPGIPVAEVLSRSISVADLPAHRTARSAGPAVRCELGLAHLISTRRGEQPQRAGGHRDARITAEALAKLRRGGPASPEQLLPGAGGPARRGTAITAMINSFGV